MRRERRPDRTGEIIALIVVGVVGIIGVAAGVLSDSWDGLGAAILLVLLAGPLYLAWIVWFVVRSSRR